MAWVSDNAAWIALFFMCFYICAYAWSWGPLPWLYAAEVQFLETRSAGQSIATLINLLFSFVIGQASPIFPHCNVFQPSLRLLQRCALRPRSSQSLQKSAHRPFDTDWLSKIQKG